MSNDQHLAQMSGRIINALQTGQIAAAEKMCTDVLRSEPSSPPFLRLMAHVYIRQNKLPEATKQLEFALTIAPDFPPILEDLGSVLAQQGDLEKALPLLEKAARLDPTQARVHKKIGQVLNALGRSQDADKAYSDFFERDPDKEIVAIGLEHMRAGRVDEAEETFKKALRQNPDNVDALRLMANLYHEHDKKPGDVEALLRRAVEIAPDYIGAWLMLGSVLTQRFRGNDAIPCYQEVLKHDPDNIEALSGLASAFANAGYPEKAKETYDDLVATRGDSPGVHLGYAHVQKTMGDQAGSLKSYRRAIELKPDFGEAYWSMANLKIFKFEDTEITAMEDQIANNSELSENARIHMLFSLGKAYEDRKDFDNAWKHYNEGNETQRPLVSHDPVQMEQLHDHLIEVFTPEFVEKHKTSGNDAEDPIVIVGLPRTGSTLIEQILASHSKVEGTSELPDLGRIAMSVGKYRLDKVRYPHTLLDLRDIDFNGYGKEYLDAAARHRKTDAPLFTDKLPNNFAHIGFLKLILPNAKIINTRRHPVDSCLGAYKQLFARGQNFTYDMFDLLEYYKQYDRLMQHWHNVFPGEILDVHYEDTVLDLEGQVHKLLDYCKLDLEEACMKFYETKRAVQTASSEQVRQPIYKSALGKWRQYGEHLDFWSEGLEDIINRLPDHVKNAGL